MAEKLAIYGGPKAVPGGTIKSWPPIDGTDEEMVLAALRGQKHAAHNGENCPALQEELAEWNGNRYCITTNSGPLGIGSSIAAARGDR